MTSVLVLTNMYPSADKPFHGTFVEKQVESLRENGIKVDVLYVDGVASKLNYLWGFPRLWARLLHRRYDLIHAHYVFSGIIARAQFLCPTVLTHHGSQVFRGRQAPLCQAVTPLMDRTIVVSEEMREKGYLDKSVVIPCGVDLEQFKPMTKEEARRKLNLPQDKKLVLYAGEYFRPIKRFDIVQKSMKVLRDRDPDVELVLVAKKPLNEVPMYMNACDVLVLVSDGEGSPQVIKEAMACNLPIVSVPVGDVPQVIEGTEGCYLCSQDPEDVADKLELALQRGKRTDGRKMIKHLELGAISRRIIKLYDDLLDEKKGSGLGRLFFWRKDNKMGAEGIAKRVCIVRQASYPAQKNVRRNAETLAKEGYEVDVICQRQRGSQKREMLNGVNVHRLPVRHHRGNILWYLYDYLAFFALASLKLAQLHFRKRYDVVEVNTMPDFEVFVAIIPKLLGSKVILYMYENTPGLFISSFRTGPNHIIARILRFIERISASYADRVIVSDGQPYKEILESQGIPSSKITVVLNVPDDTIFDPQLIPPSKDGNHFRLIVVSTLVKRYGIQTLIKAIPLLVDEIPNLVVDVVGGGQYRPALERIASELNVEKYVNFLGYIRHDDVPPYIARADVGVAPMIDDVGAPNKLFEYFALGKPSVISALPGLTAMFNDDCTRYFQPGNETDLAAQIIDLYRSPEQRRSLGDSSHKLYQKLRWSAMKHKYLKVYQQLLGKDEKEREERG